jgi:hypothetical protein
MASRLYAAMISAATPMVPQKLMPLWNHAAGPKTVFFWAPGELTTTTQRFNQNLSLTMVICFSF